MTQCISCGKLPNKKQIEWRKFELLMQLLQKPATDEKFEIFMNRGSLK